MLGCTACCQAASVTLQVFNLVHLGGKVTRSDRSGLVEQCDPVQAGVPKPAQLSTANFQRDTRTDCLACLLYAAPMCIPTGQPSCAAAASCEGMVIPAAMIFSAARPHVTVPSSFRSAVCLGHGSARPASNAALLSPWNHPLRHSNCVKRSSHATHRTCSLSYRTLNKRMLQGSYAMPAGHGQSRCSDGAGDAHTVDHCTAESFRQATHPLLQRDRWSTRARMRRRPLCRGCADGNVWACTCKGIGTSFTAVGKPATDRA